MAATLKIFHDRLGTDANPADNRDCDALSPNLRFRTDDGYEINTTNPIPIVTGQTKRSFWKQTYLKCTIAPGTKVDNVKIYTDGTGWTGVTVKVGDETPTKTSISDAGYEVATGSVGDTGDEMVAAHALLTGSTDLFSFVSGSPKDVSISEAGNIIDAIDDTTDYVIIQFDVADTASPGDLVDETLTWRYDEI